VVSVDSSVAGTACPELQSPDRGVVQPESGPERRREERRQVDVSGATATVMGEESSMPCRIVNSSRNGMRIEVSKTIATGEQVHVQWNEEFFVGAVRYAIPKGEQYHLGLRLVTRSSGRASGEAGRIIVLVRNLGTYTALAVAGAIGRLAGILLGARSRPDSKTKLKSIR
jgi:hypothetical protein